MIDKTDGTITIEFKSAYIISNIEDLIYDCIENNINKEDAFGEFKDFDLYTLEKIYLNNLNNFKISNLEEIKATFNIIYDKINKKIKKKKKKKLER